MDQFSDDDDSIVASALAPVDDARSTMASSSSAK
jgi:hypothetical protein